MDFDETVAAKELFEDNDVVFPVLMGRENLKVALASPGSESSGVSSLDAEEAKKLANDQLATSNSSPESASERNSSEKTEGESSDENNDNNEKSSDNDTSTKQPVTVPDSNDEQEQRSPESADNAEVDETKTTEKTEVAIEAKSEDKNEEEVSVESVTSTNTCDDITPTTHDISTTSEDNLDDNRSEDLKLMYGDRDILDLASNLKDSYNMKYTHLPDFNIPMYMSNRSQYHRLGSSWDTHELKHGFCRRCGFRYIIDNLNVAHTAKTCIIDSANALFNLNNIGGLATPPTNDTTTNNIQISQAVPRISPINSSLNPATPKFQPSLTPGPGQMFNNMNTNNNPANNQHQHSFGYQNQMAAPNNNIVYKQQNNHHQQKQQHHHQQQQNAHSNSFYGNMTLNSMINQLALETNIAAINSNQYLNGGGNGTNYTPNNQMAMNPSASIINQLMNHNRQNQSGMCRPPANKSGINLNANSHNKMPAYKMYSHF